MNRVIPADQPEGSSPLALLIIPPLQAKQEQAKKQEHITLEAAMQSLVLDKRHPIALELAGTAERRSFIVRATTQTALDHVEALLRSQYPQLEARPLRDYEDPFRLEPYEAVSAVELVAGGESYLPLRTWQKSRQEQEDIDPVLALLAALSKLPNNIRAVAQLGLAPAPITWSGKHLRKSVEQALEPEKLERQRDMMVTRISGREYTISTGGLVCAGILLGLYLLVRTWLPGWAWPALFALFTGHNPHLAFAQILVLASWGVGLAVGGVLLFLILELLHRILHPTPIYDPRVVAEKTSRMAYRTRLRLYVIGPKTREGSLTIPVAQESTKEHPDTFWERLRAEREMNELRQEVLLRLIAAYRQFHQASGAYFVPRQIRPKKAEHFVSRNRERQGWPQGLNQSKHLLTVDALAALWHLPPAEALPEMALVEHRRARTLLIPPEVASLAAGRTPVGYSEHGGYRLPFALAPQFFTFHTLIAGKSGEGKSTCMEHIAREAMEQGGLILIDPHGDLCDHVLNLVPPSRAEDVVLIDLSDPTAAVGINALDVTLGRGRDKAISDLMKTFSHIWMTAWGPRMENAFEMSLRTLFEANKILVAQDPQNGPRQQYTLLDVLPILTNENFCHAILQQIDDDYLHRWWREYYQPLTLWQQRDVINPVITKVAKFESLIARRIIGQGTATLNFSQMIAERKIVLAKLAKGVVGADVAAILGATMLSLLQITLEEQGTKAEMARVRFPIILDEFQVLAGVDYAALAELRKYGATFFLATQSLEYLQKLDPVLLPTVLANVKQLMIFHMSAQDAESLYMELGVEQEDILNLDMYTCYVKLPSANRRQPSFSVRMLPSPVGDLIQAESIRTRCRVRYTCPVDVVDGMLREAMIRSIRLGPTSKVPPSKQNGKTQNPASTSREAPLADGASPILLPAASSLSPSAQAAPIEAEPRKRRHRGRRSRQRAEQFKEEQRGEIIPMAFGEEFSDGNVIAENDATSDQELLEINAYHEGIENNGH